MMRTAPCRARGELEPKAGVVLLMTEPVEVNGETEV